MIRLVMVLSVVLCQPVLAFIDSIESLFGNDVIEAELSLHSGPLIINEGEVSSLFVARSYLFPETHNPEIIATKDKVFTDIAHLGKEAAKIEIVGYMIDSGDVVDRFNLIDQLSQLQKRVYEILGDQEYHNRGKLVMISSIVSDYPGSVRSDDDQIEVKYYPEWTLGEYR